MWIILQLQKQEDFYFGTAVAERLNIGCVPVRKEGKLPPSTVEAKIEYEKEYGKDMTVIATGGLARMIAEESSTIDKTDHFLTLTGLRVLYERNAASRKGYLERLKNKPLNNL